MVNERSINGQAGKIVSKWVTLANNAIPSNVPPQWDLDLKGQQYSEPTKCIGKQIDYMAKPETKLNDFNREASKSLYDWSDANVWGYSNGWARHEIKKETLSITGFHAVRRILKAVQALRKDNYKAKRQIQRTLKRQDINRSPITPFQAPLISKHDWDLSVIAVTKEAETERRELLSSQIINSNKVQTHPLLRMLRRARVRASRAKRESGGYDHYY
ncbi:replication protein [Escherichia coli]|nr:replication protein [Escherichia coli]